MPDLIKPILDWMQTNLGAAIAGGLVVAAAGGLIGLVFRRGRGRQVTVMELPHVGGSVLNVGQLTINVYLDGLPESKDERKKALFEEGLAHQEANRHPQAIQAFRACLALENTPSERAALLILIGASFHLQSRFAEAEGNWREALAEARAGSDREAEAAALGNLGNVYAQKGELDRALEHHQKALKIDREIGHRLGEATALGNLGAVYAQKGELDRALEHLQAALKIDREIGHRPGEAAALGNLGNVYLLKGDLDEALEHHQAALRLDREIGHRLGEALDLADLGIVYYRKEELEKALEHLQVALEIFRAIGAKAEEAKILEMLIADIADLEAGK